ncbi:PKD domain-containing protein, partial [Myxococcota bacterium]|nr:PKD domain-containing protein [Myxococcota bacterium]
MARWNYLFILGFLLALPGGAFAQEQDQVLIVPYSQINPELPHPAHSGAPVTLKGIVRNAQCSTYTVAWDTNFNGNFNDDWSRSVSRHSQSYNVQDIGRTYQIPVVPEDTLLIINVRVTPQCGGRPAKYASMRFFVYAFEPSRDPRNWTHDQLEIINQMSIQEGLWFLHRMQQNITNRNTVDIYSNAVNHQVNGIHFWSYSINGHMPAYPPGTINWHAIPRNQAWENANDFRWNNDPYAETSYRLVNYVVRNSGWRNVEAADDDDTCGFTAAGAVKRCNRIAGTDDSRSAYAHNYNNYTYVGGMDLAALSTLLSVFKDTPVQVSTFSGNTWQWYIQQMVDYVGWMQIDSCNGAGGWLYTSQGCQSDGGMDQSTTQWAYIGIESADLAGGPAGVIVNNRHKYRITQALERNQIVSSSREHDGGGAYRSSETRSNLQLTGGAFVGTRWLGYDQFSVNSNAIPFPGYYQNRTQAQLRRIYDRYISFTDYNWNDVQRRGHGGSWTDGFWSNGSYLCNNTNTVYNAGRCGNSYAIYSHQKGYRTTAPGSQELTAIGNHDWNREFNIYYARSQDRAMNVNDPMSGYSVFGRFRDDYCDGTSVTCNYGVGSGVQGLTMAMGILVQTPTIFNPKPIAIGSGAPTTVIEGCSGANSGRVTFTHEGSFHPKPGGQIVAYRWDANLADGLWWDNGNAPVDFSTDDPAQEFVFRYPNIGQYTATLQVEDEIGQTSTTTVVITVNASVNEAPSVAHGGPYVIEVGQNLQLNGS